MKTTLLAGALLILAVLGALVEGLWNGIPTVLVQVNGLVLVLSALALAWQGARLMLRRASPNRPRGSPGSVSSPSASAGSTSAPR